MYSSGRNWVLTIPLEKMEQKLIGGRRKFFLKSSQTPFTNASRICGQTPSNKGRMMKS